MSQFEIIGTPAMRGFNRYVMPFSAYSLRRHSCFGASVTASSNDLEQSRRGAPLERDLRYATMRGKQPTN
jgi:hypothetical protein